MATKIIHTSKGSGLTPQIKEEKDKVFYDLGQLSKTLRVRLHVVFIFW